MAASAANPTGAGADDASNHHADDSNRRDSAMTEFDALEPSTLDRMDPDSILADEADPDTLLGADSDSEAAGSRRASLAQGASAQRQSKTLQSPQLEPGAQVDTKTSDTILATPTQTRFPSPTSREEIEKLRAQVEDLTNQVTGLNGKLVNSFMRISDLEDDLSDARERVMSGSTKVAELEKERQEHLAALNTGLLVEKVHVSTEMQRMMDRVIEETKQRGQAESDKAKIEAELDELSASLFNEANRMVAVERLSRARAEEKSKQTEERLQDTEGIMLEQQKVLGNLQRELEELKAREEARNSAEGDSTRAMVPAAKDSNSGLGLPASHAGGFSNAASRRASFHPDPMVDAQLLMLDIVPYQELRAFLGHLRKVRLQLAPFYTYPYEPRRPNAPDRSSGSLENYAANANRVTSPGAHTTLQSAAAFSSYGMATDYNGTIHTSPFALAGVTRHKDYPLLPSNCEQFVQIASQMSLPFIKRAQEEDSEPCLRLDIAPGLNWLTRRTANSAILDGSLLIEPIFPGGVVPDHEAIRQQYAHLPPAGCAMCGMHLVNVPLPGGEEQRSSGTPDLRSVTSWASSMAAATGSAASSLREAASGAGTSSSAGSPRPDGAAEQSRLKSSRSGLFSSLSSLRGMTGSPKPTREPPAQLAETPSEDQPPALTSPAPATPAAQLATTGPLPVPTHIFRLSETSSSRYLLCPHHCLTRLRAACAFWGYLRSIERAVVLEGKLAWDDPPHNQSQAHLPRATAKKAVDVQEDSKRPSLEEGAAKVASDKGGEAGNAEKADGGSKQDAGAGADADETIVSKSEAAASEEQSANADGADAAKAEAEAGAEAGEDDEAESSPKATRSSVISTSDESNYSDARASDTSEAAPEGAPQAEAGADEGKSPAETEAETETEAVVPTTPSRPAASASASTPTAGSTPVPPTLPPRRATRPVPTPPRPTLPPRRNTGSASNSSLAVPTTPGAGAGPQPSGPPARRFLPLSGVPLPSGGGGGAGAGAAEGTAPPASADASAGAGAAPLNWEERVYLEVMRLKREMWEARAGLVPHEMVARVQAASGSGSGASTATATAAATPAPAPEPAVASKGEGDETVKLKDVSGEGSSGAEVTAEAEGEKPSDSASEGKDGEGSAAGKEQGEGQAGGVGQSKDETEKGKDEREQETQSEAGAAGEEGTEAGEAAEEADKAQA